MRRLSLSILCALSLAATACRPEGTIQVHSLGFDGVKSVDASLLKSVLVTRENSKVPLVGWQLPWGRKHYFDRTQFDADLQRIKAFYADRGFPDARVTGIDVKLNDKQDAVDVTVSVAEGEPVTVAAVEWLGFEVIPPDHLSAMTERMPLVVGKPRDRHAVVATHELAVNELRDHGYPYAQVETREHEAPTGGTQTTVTFTATPGVLARFGPVEIVGTRSVSDDVVRRQLTFRQGELYRRSVVQDSQRRLYGMELFQFASVAPANPEQQDPEVPIKVTVSEGKHQRINFSVGYGTEERARVDAKYRHVNFLGGARSAGVHARYSSLDRGLRLDLNQPYFFTPHFSAGLEGQRWYTYAPAYRSVVTGGKATVTHRSSAQTLWAVSMTNERTASTIEPFVLDDPKSHTALIALGLDPTTSVQAGTVAAIGFDLQRSTADSVLDPRRGYQLAFHTEEAGRLLPGTFNYYSFSVDGRHYLPIGSRFTVANRLQVGAINAAGDDPRQVPFSRKFFLGGAASLRGWGRYEVSPLTDTGLPIGGNSLIAASSELRLNLRGKLGAVLFVDAGNVWAGDWEVRLNDLRFDVGPGLRYQTPIGPIRVDLGVQLNPNEALQASATSTARPWRLHISIGQAF